MTAAQSRSVIARLVARFAEQHDSYTHPSYKETQLRREFIDPTWKALGWDIDNERGYAEQYKDVIHEDAIKVSADQFTKAPDYCFRIGGVRKFFLEAKKPSTDVKHDPVPAFQLRRYAWSQKLSLSVLTDFEELAVYDTRVKPVEGDSPGAARVLLIPFTEYEDRWDEIAGLLSREAVLRGAFDKFAESKKKRGTQEVDEAFLDEIEKWRSDLARNLALRNEITQEELNFAVQAIIDRIIFLRICEDRGIELYGELQALQNGTNVYERLVELFRRADQKYNSGLFHFADERGRSSAPDRLTPSLELDDQVLKRISRSLYYPAPYEFSVLPADILGQVYEQFLGKVIRLTPGGQAKVEEKPEVRKAGGVYYTPTYIVDYIVKHTVGPLLEGKTPAKVGGKNPVRVLDPACGSGTFLLQAYQFLLDWHRDRYVEEEPKKHAKGRAPKLYQAAGGEWRLTTGERKRILLTHIYGVDIDPQAVEVTKLSLLLKVLEGESDQTLQTTMRLFNERALPDLDDNIKCGNSIVGPDYYEQGALPLAADDSTNVNAFDWRSEFPVVFTSGGFDAVIGNPPYVDSELMAQLAPRVREYCTRLFTAASGNWDLYCVFTEKALDVCRAGGRSTLIVPNKLASAGYATGARKVIAGMNRLLSIRDYSRVRVFPVSVYPIVYSASKAPPDTTSFVDSEIMKRELTGQPTVLSTTKLPYNSFTDPAAPWLIVGGAALRTMIDRLRSSFPSLGEIAEVWGAATVAEAYEMGPLIEEAGDGRLNGLKIVNSGTIDRFVALWGIKPMRYLGNSFTRPIIASKHHAKLAERRLRQATAPKIIVAGMTLVLECFHDRAGSYVAAKSTTVITSDLNLEYLSGVLNSSLVSYIYRQIFGGDALQGDYLRIGPPQLKKLPIPTGTRNSSDSEMRDAIAKLAARLAELKERVARTRTAHEVTGLHRQIAAAEEQLDDMVFRLYRLSATEVMEIQRAKLVR